MGWAFLSVSWSLSVADALLSLCSQLLNFLARQVEVALFDLHSDGQAYDHVDIEFTVRPNWPDPNSTTLPMQLSHYVSSGKAATIGHRNYGYASDKANPAKKSVMNAVIALPNNVAILCVPQVSPLGQSG